MESLSEPRIVWGVALRAHPAQSVLGDAYLVKPLGNGLLIAVADGLGHGSEAAAVGSLCVDTLSANADRPLPAMLALCHEILRGTRVVTVSVAAFDYARNEMTWSGLGNVMGALFRADPAARPKSENLVQRPGVLGSGTPAFVAPRLPVRHDDLLVLATDGIDPEFERSVDRGRAPQAIAERILADHAKDTDDALVLVARYGGIRA